MPLPIVLGGKSVSAQSLPGPCGRPDESDDGVLLEPLELYQTLGWGVCPQKEWLVRVCCSYYDLVDCNTGRRDCSMAEVRIQVSPLSRSLSTDYRETAHHLKLFDGAPSEYPQSQPQVVVSSDRRNLAVLLFHPHQQSSAMVIFQLRRPRTDIPGTTNPIPLPLYIQKTMATAEDSTSDANSSAISEISRRDPPAVATHPRFVSVWGISAICSLPQVSPCVFLAACQDGTLVWLDARSSMALATGMLSGVKPEQLPFSSITAAPSSTSTNTMNQGRFLAVTSNGNAILCQWQLESTTRVQQTMLKRASTGTVVWQASLGESPTTQIRKLSQQHPSPQLPFAPKSPTETMHKSPSKRMQSLIIPMIQRTVPGRAVSATNSSSDLPPLRLSYGKKQETPHSAPPASPSRNNSDIAELALKELHDSKSELFHSPLLQQRKTQQPRRRSDIAKPPGENGASGDTTLARRMQLQVLASIGTESDGHESDVVVDAIFCSPPSLMCVLYQHHPSQRRLAEVVSFDGTASLQPVLCLSLTSEQLEQAYNVHSSYQTKVLRPNDKITPISTSLRCRFGLEFDPSSATLAISGHVATDDRWVGCLWNWRENTLGWMIQNTNAVASHSMPTLWSRLYFANHPQDGPSLVYLETRQDKYLHNRKQVISTGILSPRSENSTAPGIVHPNSLLLTFDSVHFPAVTQQSSGFNAWELEWKISTLPLNYRNLYGPPQIAAVGYRNGRSIAVASSNGVCVLDNRYRKWKQFGTPNEERSFQVVTMAWWEGQSLYGDEASTEDLLVAVIQSNNGRQYLSCWSPKR